MTRDGCSATDKHIKKVRRGDNLSAGRDATVQLTRGRQLRHSAPARMGAPPIVTRSYNWETSTPARMGATLPPAYARRSCVHGYNAPGRLLGARPAVRVGSLAVFLLCSPFAYARRGCVHGSLAEGKVDCGMIVQRMRA